MGNTVNTGGDPNVQAGLANLLALADPKALAEGTALQARARNFDAETRYHTARAAGLEDQNKVLSDEALIAAGITDPVERAAYRATRTNSAADWFLGRNRNIGAGLIKNPTATDDEIRKAALLFGLEKAGSKDFAGTGERANTLLSQEYASLLARVIDKAKIDADAKKDVAKIAAGATTDAANIRAAAGVGGKVDPNTLPFVTRDPGADVSRLFGVTDDDGNWVPPSEEDVVQPILRMANSLIASKQATRENAIEMAIAVLGFLPKKDVVKEGFRELEVTKPRPAKAKPIDPSVTEDGMDAGELIQVPTDNPGLLRDPDGPVVNADIGTVIQFGNIAYRRVQGGLQRIR
jgi:hypothetical protein